MKLFCRKKKKITIEGMYDQIKNALHSGEITVNDAQAIAELTTELAARTKEADGE